MQLLEIIEKWNSNDSQDRISALQLLTTLSVSEILNNIVMIREIINESLYADFRDYGSVDIWVVSLNICNEIVTKHGVELMPMGKTNSQVYQSHDADKNEDCEIIGKVHSWFNCDNKHSGCYNCGKVVTGRFWQ